MASNPSPTEYDLTPMPASDLRAYAPAAARPASAKSSAAVGLTPLFVMLSGGLIIGAIILFNRTGLDHGVNDASRWDTVYYLVVHRTYEFLPNHDAWWSKKDWTLPQDMPPFPTYDMVALKDANGNYHYRSSKPPLLPTCVAGVVIAVEKVSAAIEPGVRWLFEKIAMRKLRPDHDGGHGLPTQASFRKTPNFIIPVTLILVQAIPFMLFVWIIAKQFSESTASPLVMYFCVAAAALGTYLTAWSVTLNNHVAAACTALFATHAMLRIWYDGRREWYWFALAGLLAGFLCALELPALALTVMLLAALIWKDWRRGLFIAVTCAAIPVAAHLLTNYLDFGTFRPAYADIGKAGGLYDFPGSHWVPYPTTGLDAMHEPKDFYLMNLLVGHHGLFLLTPVLLLSLIGMGRHLRSCGLGFAFLASLVLLAAGGIVYGNAAGDAAIVEWLDRVTKPLTGGGGLHLPRGYLPLAPLGLLLMVNLGMYLQAPAKPRPMLALLVLVVTAVVVGFYTIKSGNYGGGNQGARWLLWLTPLWLLLLPAGVEWLLARRGGRAVCCMLLLISTMSVAYAFRQPWGESWAHVFFRHMGWIKLY